MALAYWSSGRLLVGSRTRARIYGLAALIFTLQCLSGCDSGTSQAPAATPEVSPDQLTSEPQDLIESPGADTRVALFGDLHVHTSWSTDAYSGGNRVGPRDAYRFARGEAVTLPNGIVTQLPVPLDFTAITDHAEGFDAIAACTYPEHPQYASDACENMRNPTMNQADYLRGAFERGTARPARRLPDLCADESVCLESARATWQRTQEVAEEFNDPGRFTTLIGYEFSALLPQFGMLHRNVIFRGHDVIPHAYSSLDVSDQADFFQKLDAACQAPCEVLTIPHNSNYSWGLLFSRTDEDGSAYTAEDLARRSRIERLVEVTQAKGSSECQIGVGAADEECDFGNLFEVCAPDQFGRCATESSFVRNALLDGMQMASEGRTNPFKLGMIGSTDTHQSDPGNTDAQSPARFANAVGNAQAVEQIFQQSHVVAGAFRRFTEGGLAAVWAGANTRDEIFDALQRREAFATSGSRIRVRFFAGDLPADLGNRSDPVELAYQNGVPMGAELTAEQPPAFWVWAAADSASATLDKVQVIKGWLEAGEKRQRVWDVACSAGRRPDAAGRCPETPASVDLESCERRDDSGAAELQASFTDAEFTAEKSAFYYVRVLENPSCRWTTWLANSADIAVPGDVPETVQHRAWSSPIWVNN
jgi:hypothetical protein